MRGRMSRRRWRGSTSAWSAAAVRPASRRSGWWRPPAPGRPCGKRWSGRGRGRSGSSPPSRRASGPGRPPSAPAGTRRGVLPQIPPAPPGPPRTGGYTDQHAHNPVDWYPWGEEAFARARREDKPVLLSVGYSACHWCHVMERESFEDPEIARRMNENFVCVKVDREERPDVDQIYMQAVQSMTGHGGWPMTVFLTPDGVTFYSGTSLSPPLLA